MKLLALAFLGVVSAQTKCESDADCGEAVDGGAYVGGCCMRWEVVSTKAEGAVWGKFSSIWGGEEAIVPGAGFQACAGKAQLDGHVNKNGSPPDKGTVPNYDDLQNFLDTVPGAKEKMGAENVDEWIEAWEGDADTQKEFILKVGCASTFGAIKLAASAALAASAFYLY